MPALGYYLGAAFASILLALRARASAGAAARPRSIAGLAAAALAYAAARIGGTPYTAAKAIEIGAPLARPGHRPAAAAAGPGRPACCYRRCARSSRGVCSLLALANAPVGPTSYSPALTEPACRRSPTGSTLVLASRQLLEDEHGVPYIAWELRGGRVCIDASDEAGNQPPPGVRYVVTESAPGQAPYPGLRVKRVARPYVLWQRIAAVHGHSPCPLIAVRQARQGAKH